MTQPTIYPIRSYKHAEDMIDVWWHANKPVRIGPPGYLIEMRGTFFVRARLAKEGQRIAVTEWQAVCGRWLREGAYSVPLTDNARYVETSDILLFYPIAGCEIRLSRPE